ncbi:pentapeptide repeat-containing protein [Exiguobacterium sp. SH5S13]|uniref:pentapeptide repeat-containing protein n=1 Tax=Exiguobacterium sp. SH5S13 TaxID=2510959 RepID=UPI001F18FC7F|nr:pentapeptide repeat-containing protein [Exiguobacterium sp. SH5S13]
MVSSSREFDQCKTTGSSFESCTFGGVTVRGGDWSFVNLRHAPLRKMDWSDVRLVEADLYGADLKESRWTNAALTRAVLQHADCTAADFIGADMDGVDFTDVTLKKTKLDVMQAVQVARSLGAIVE